MGIKNRGEKKQYLNTETMNFNGTIIITDPCYIIKECPLECPKPEDFNLSYSIHSKPYDQYSTPDELAYKAACDKYWKERSEYDDWEKCEYGENMETLGITTYISESTIYGDWSCTTWSTPNRDVENQIEELNKLCADACRAEEEYGWDSTQSKECEERISKDTVDIVKLGNFCADAGMVAVFLLDEVLKYNPEFYKWIEEHPWCVTVISDFDGDIQYHIDKCGDAHIIGKGNINFFTTQFSL